MSVRGFGQAIAVTMDACATSNLGLHTGADAVPVRYADIPGQAIVNFPHRGENDIQVIAGFSGGMALASLLSVRARDHAGDVHSVVNEREGMLLFVFGEFEDAGWGAPRNERLPSTGC